MSANSVVEVAGDLDLVTRTEVQDVTRDDEEVVEEDKGGFVEVEDESNETSSIGNNEKAIE